MDTTARDANSLISANQHIPSSWQTVVSRKLTSILPTVFALGVGMILWELAGRVLQFQFLPPFSNVLFALVDLVVNGKVLEYLASSLVALVIGYLLAVVCGTILGMLMGRYQKIEYALDIYVTAFLAAPKIALVPVLFALFGVNRSVQVIVVFLSTVFIIIVTTESAIRTVDEKYIEMAKSFGVKEHQLFWKILLPGALPLIMAGLRLGMGRAVRGMINGEMFIAIFGLGSLLRTYGNRFDAEKVFAILLVVVSVALIFTSIVQFIEWRLTKWIQINS